MTENHDRADKHAGSQVLVVDDDSASSQKLEIQLQFAGEKPLLCTSSEWQELAASVPEQALLAIVVGVIRDAGLQQVLSDLHQHYPGLPILLLGNLDQAEAAAVPTSLFSQLHWLGSAELTHESLSHALLQARARKGLAAPADKSRIFSLAGPVLFRSLSGSSAAISRIRQLIQQVARRDVSVLLKGESGAGKEVVARNLHYHSGRGSKPFVAVNCAALSADSYAVELFGQVPDTRLPRPAAGLLEQAEGGTLYFDEVGALPLSIQTILLRYLEDRTYCRCGGSEIFSSDVRVIAGTTQNLEARISQGMFRKDLFYRLNQMPLELPPLRQRLDDLPELVQEVLKHLESRSYEVCSLNAAAMAALRRHQWPGNVRELANLIERLCIMHEGAVIGFSALPPEYQYGETESEAGSEQAPDLTGQAEAGLGESGEAALKSAVEAATAQGQNEVRASAVFSGKSDGGSAIPPLSDSLLLQYLQNFEKQLLLTAMDDCGQIPGIAAERLNLTEAELAAKIRSFETA